MFDVIYEYFESLRSLTPRKKSINLAEGKMCTPFNGSYCFVLDMLFFPENFSTVFK